MRKSAVHREQRRPATERNDIWSMRKSAVHREQRRPATERNDIWSMDCYLSRDASTLGSLWHTGRTRAQGVTKLGREVAIKVLLEGALYAWASVVSWSYRDV